MVSRMACRKPRWIVFPSISKATGRVGERGMIGRCSPNSVPYSPAYLSASTFSCVNKSNSSRGCHCLGVTKIGAVELVIGLLQSCQVNLNSPNVLVSFFWRATTVEDVNLLYVIPTACRLVGRWISPMYSMNIYLGMSRYTRYLCIL